MNWWQQSSAWAAFLPLAALLLDLALGDPRSWPHPVRLLGLGADGLERLVRVLPQGLHRLGGALAALLLAGAAGAGAALLAMIPYAGPFLALYLAYAGLALGCLLRSAERARKALAQAEATGDLAPARCEVGGLVSRDAHAMDLAGLSRSLAESLSENLGDGLVAPFFWLALGSCLGPWQGVALLWGYKAVSTLDSMWGYRNERFERVGWGAARLDDILACVPARLTAAGYLAAGWLAGLVRLRDLIGMWRRVAKDGRSTDSPNAGWPMAAAAWLMAAPVGGPTPYGGKVKHKPVLGPAQGSWDQSRLGGLLGVSLVAGLLTALVLHGGFAALGLALRYLVAV